MKKILLSLGVIAVVGIVVAGATGAFYNDTETSTGNIFTAGSIDLKVDHLKQTYNGVDCQTCNVRVVSDTTNMVVAKNGVANSPYPAVQVTPTSITNTYWTASTSPSLANSQWIWATDPVTQEDVDNNTIYTFQKTFVWNGPTIGATLSFSLGADNSYEVWLNGDKIGEDITENNHSIPDTITILASDIDQGVNTLQFKVKNWAQPGNILNNPGGLRYVLTIDGNCGAEYFQNHCSLWQEKDLGAGDTFFNFGDVKPADWGTNVISLHVSSNDAYACLIVGNKDDQENTLLSPEISAGDAVGFGNPTGKGELSNFLNVFTWGDTNGNGVYDSGESQLGSGPLSSLSSIMSMDSSNHQFLTATTTKNIGLVWCAGTLTTPVPGNPFVCNGSGMGNIAQSDSFTADLTAYAEQVRNNPNFSCANVVILLP